MTQTFFSTRLISCCYFGFIGLLSFLYLSILWFSLLNLIRFSLRLCNTFPFIKYCRGSFLKVDIFFSIWSCSCSCLRHVHKLSFHRILIILFRPPLFENDRFNKDGQKNKREYINKAERNTCKDYPFHK